MDIAGEGCDTSTPVQVLSCCSSSSSSGVCSAVPLPVGGVSPRDCPCLRGYGPFSWRQQPPSSAEPSSWTRRKASRPALVLLLAGARICCWLWCFFWLLLPLLVLLAAPCF